MVIYFIILQGFLDVIVLLMVLFNDYCGIFCLIDVNLCVHDACVLFLLKFDRFINFDISGQIVVVHILL